MSTSFRTQRYVLSTFVARTLILLFVTSDAAWSQERPVLPPSLQHTTRATSKIVMPSTAEPSAATPAWTAATACPASVDRYAFAQNGEDFYVISGFVTGGPTAAVRRYNATTNIWTSLANIPAASEAPAAAYFGGKIYVVTGLGPANALYIYNIATNTWSSGAARPGVVDSYGAAAGAFNGKVYVVGGGSAGPTSTVSIYDIAGNSWSAGAAAPTPVLLAGYAQAGQFLYVIGGFSASPAANSTASRRLDMATNTWSSGPTFTPQRGDFGLAAAGTKLIAIGGDASGVDFFDPTPFVDELDTSTWPAGTWIQSPDDLPSARQGNSAGFISTGRVGGEIWTTAGSAATFINEHLFRSAPTCLTYNFTTSTGSIVPGTTDTLNHGDDGSTVIALPFPYRLYDQDFSNVRVGSNGHLTFGTPNDTSNPTCIPVSGATYAIGPYWTDQCTGTCTGVNGAGLGIFTSVSGVAPNRIFNIEWRTAYYNSGGGAGVPLNYEVRLYERQASFDVIYGTVNTFSPPSARSLSTGVQKNETAGQFTLQGCDPTGGTAPPVSSGQLYHYTLTSTTCAPAPALTGFLYALNDSNGVANQLYGFSVNETTGVLTLLPGFPLATGGNGGGAVSSKHLALDSVNQRLYAINDGSETVSAYSIGPTTGALTPMPFSTIALGAGLWNAAAVHPSGSPLVVGSFDSSIQVRSYAITATTATEAAGSPYSTAPARAFSAAFSRDGGFYYVGGSNTTFAGFSVNAGNGVLTALAGSPFNSGGNLPGAYATDSLGRFLSADFSAAVRVFTTAAGVPSAVTGNPFASGLSGAVDGVLHPNEQFYFVADRSGNRFGSYRMSGSGSATTLTPVIGSPFASGGTLTDALVMNQTGAFLYGANGDSRNLTTYSVNSSSGVLSSQIVQAMNTLGATGRLTGIAYTNPSMVRAAVSRKTHGAAGVFDINLPLTGTRGVECRNGSGAGLNDHQIVVAFAAPVTVPSIIVTSGTIGGGSFAVAGNVVTISLSGVANAQTVTLRFEGVTDGVNTGTVDIPIGFLVGDTVSTGSVNGTDVSQTKLQSGQAVSGSNFRNDVTVSGSINGTDVSSVKLKSGTGLP